jgi:hypothetical protein
MSKIFGYTNKGNNSKGWFKSDSYSDKEIEAIKDPEGGVEVSLPTAIPSPFARIDLVKTAFRNINKTPALKQHIRDGMVIASKSDEKLVSDSLDLAEILFNIDSIREIKEKVEIIKWNKEVELTKLKNSKNDKHRRFAETLELYLDQDKESYNFNLVDSLYLIKYDHQIIGCTSPVTLFFATGSDLSDAQVKLTKNDVTFDEKYTPLYERDVEFQKYIYLLYEANPYKDKMKDFGEYLNKNIKILKTTNPELFNELNTLNANDYYLNYSELDAGASGDIVEIIGIPLRKRKEEGIVSSLESSDFVIKASKNPGGLLPLVLQNNLNKPLRYANDAWDKNIQVPFLDKEPDLSKRRLPGLGIQYPYLTVSDFLEPYLIRLVYPINKDKFFDGNLIAEVGDDSKGYILPLRKRFFDYFKSEDLISTSPGKPSIKMIQGTSNSVKVVLRIPVKNEFITFERIYFESSSNQLTKPDEAINKGIVLEHEVGITVFPFIKTRSPQMYAFHRVQLVDRDYYNLLKDNDYHLDFYTDESANPIKIVGEKPRTRSIKGVNGSETTSKYYVLENEFDFIQIKSNVASGVILPKWQPFYQGQKEFSFAVDFGTTNTHIEYKVENSVQPFDVIKQNEIQIATLFHPEKTSDDNLALLAISELIDHEFVPFQISKDSKNAKNIYKFPQRTVISESQALDIRTQPLSLADFNIPFTYEKSAEKEGTRIQSNLKWAAKGDGNEERVRAFFEEIMMLLRNKVLLNNGNLAKTNLFWFYPSSMKLGRVSDLKGVWEELFRKYFSTNKGTVGITESMAPFFYFKGESRLQGGGSYKPVVSIDIGGGTTDIVVFREDKPILLTSFKFAANALFGDGFSQYGTRSNGFVNKYLSHFEGLLEKNGLVELSRVLSSIKGKSRNEDINAFFFSIEDNPRIQSKSLFSYNRTLSRDEDLKIVFLYFYAAIIYHIAALMHSKNIDLPKNLIFSGTGSKILSIITNNLNFLSDLSKKIFEEVYNAPFNQGLVILTEENTPKEVTCKGGLMATKEDLDKTNDRAIKSILTCLENNKPNQSPDSVNDESGAAQSGENISSGNELRYKDLDESAKEKIAAYIEKFNEFFSRLSSQYKFVEVFNVTETSLKTFKDEFNKDIRDYLEAGLNYTKRLDEVTDDENEIGETLFFYPIIGTINRVTRVLTEQKGDE